MVLCIPVVAALHIRVEVAHAVVDMGAVRWRRCNPEVDRSLLLADTAWLVVDLVEGEEEEAENGEFGISLFAKFHARLAFAKVADTSIFFESTVQKIERPIIFIL